MAITILQTQVIGVGSGAATSFGTNDFPANPTLGSTFIACLSFETTTVSAVSVIDARNGAWTADADSGALAGSGGNGGGRILYFHFSNNAYNGASLNVSGSWTAGSAAMISLYEVTGLPGSSPFVNTGTAKTGTGTLTALGFTITPNTGASAALVIAASLSAGATGLAVDTGYTFATGNTGASFPAALIVDYHCHEYNTSASGAQSLNVNGTNAGGASMFAAAYGQFIVAPTPPPGPMPRQIYVMP